jgi:3-oxoacyl-[acyl-carrier-protein] synthase-3
MTRLQSSHSTHVSRQPERRKPLRRATILATGSCLPACVVDNTFFRDKLGIDTSPEWIESRIGIVERRWSVDETSTDLAVGAARSALRNAGLEASDIDLIVVATSTPDFTMPSTACLVQGRLGAHRAVAFDIVNACAGFVYAFDAATRYLHSGGFRNAIVIGVDRGSRLVNPHDRTTSVFFGDGAGATVVGSRGAGRVLASKLYSHGTSEPLFVPVGGAMSMDGKAVWNFATEILPATVLGLCKAAHISLDELKLLVPHQANRNILAAAAEQLHLPLDRVAINIDRFGNTVAGSIPIALDESFAAGRITAGDKVALVGFGAGLAWGGLLLQL